MRRRLAAAVVLAAFAAVGVAAQDYFQWRRGFRREPPRLPTADSFKGGFNFCRLMYTSVRWEPSGQGWWTDYPSADQNFSIRLSELTRAPVTRQPDGEPEHVVVPISDDALYQCPFILMADAGTVAFSDAEVARLRDYFDKGGFLWADDFWGDRSLSSFEAELARILPPSKYPVVDLTPDHPLYRMMFEFRAVPQIPSIQHWRRSGGGTSERGAESEHVDVRGISDERGRLMVLMTHNTDISDAWEREGEDPRFFYRFSPDGYAVGINVVMYAMTH